MLKKSMVILFAVVFLVSFNSTALAKTPTEVEQKINNEVGLRYTYISYTNVSLSINAIGKATCSATLSAYNTVDRVRISAYLQYYDGGWYTDQHWTVEDDDSYVVMSKERYVTSGYQYRLLVYYYAYSGSTSESTSDIDYYTY